MAMGGKYYCALKCGAGSDSAEQEGREVPAEDDDAGEAVGIRRQLQLPPPTPLGLVCPKGSTCKDAGKYHLCTYP